jgi:hypothetical protein
VRHLFLELELAQPFDKALVLDLVVPVLEFHDELFLLQTTERIFSGFPQLPVTAVPPKADSAEPLPHALVLALL